MDNASYHKSAKTRKFIESEYKNVALEFFPPYCPELNPTETCWKITRANVTNSTYFNSIEDMKEELNKFFSKHIFMLNLSNYLCR